MKKLLAATLLSVVLLAGCTNSTSENVKAANEYLNSVKQGDYKLLEETDTTVTFSVTGVDTPVTVHLGDAPTNNYTAASFANEFEHAVTTSIQKITPSFEYISKDFATSFEEGVSNVTFNYFAEHEENAPNIEIKCITIPYESGQECARQIALQLVYDKLSVNGVLHTPSGETYEFSSQAYLGSVSYRPMA